VSNERLSIDGDGLVVHELKRPFRDGTTRCLFEPLDFVARLAALVPRPRTHPVRYHGVFAPNARHRALLLATPRPPQMCAKEASKAAPSRAAMKWMQRLRRVFDIDISICPRGGGALKVLTEFAPYGGARLITCSQCYSPILRAASQPTDLIKEGRLRHQRKHCPGLSVFLSY
jgi:hypothetical protein